MTASNNQAYNFSSVNGTTIKQFSTNSVENSSLNDQETPEKVHLNSIMMPLKAGMVPLQT